MVGYGGGKERDNEKCVQHLDVSGNVPVGLLMLCHSRLVTALKTRRYYPHLTDKKLRLREASGLPIVAWLVEA